MKRLMERRLALLGLVLIVLVVGAAVLAPWIAPYPPEEQLFDGLTLEGAPLPPDARFLMGTDLLGRDLFSRILYGAQTSLIIGVVANGLALSIGTLVGITAGCASMAPGFALLSGLVAGFVVVYGMRLLDRLQLDDVVGAIPVHGFAGIWGTLAAGLFYQGDLFNWERVAVQALGAAAAFLWAFPVALVFYFLLAKTMGLRVSTQHEQRGLDFAEHAEVGYPEFNLTQTFDHAVDGRRFHRQTIQHGRIQTIGLTGGKIFLVFSHQRNAGFIQLSSNRQQRSIFYRRRRRGNHTGGGTRFAANFSHIFFDVQFRHETTCCG